MQAFTSFILEKNPREGWFILANLCWIAVFMISFLMTIYTIKIKQYFPSAIFIILTLVSIYLLYCLMESKAIFLFQKTSGDNEW